MTCIHARVISCMSLTVVSPGACKIPAKLLVLDNLAMRSLMSPLSHVWLCCSQAKGQVFSLSDTLCDSAFDFLDAFPCNRKSAEEALSGCKCGSLDNSRYVEVKLSVSQAIVGEFNNVVAGCAPDNCAQLVVIKGVVIVRRVEDSSACVSNISFHAWSSQRSCNSRFEPVRIECSVCDVLMATQSKTSWWAGGRFMADASS